MAFSRAIERVLIDAVYRSTRIYRQQYLGKESGGRTLRMTGIYEGGDRLFGVS